MKQKETTISNRNTGLDLIRILAIYMVIMLHVLGKGGIALSTKAFSLNENISYFLRMLCFVANNIFALLTGYLYVKAKYKVSKIFELWIKVFFYSAGISIIFLLISPETVEISGLIKTFFPILSTQYWYFTAYFCLFIFIPFINKFIEIIDKKTFKKLLLVLLTTFSVIGFAGRIFGNLFWLNDGTSFLWIFVLYFVGAYLKIYKDDFNKHSNNTHLLLYFLSIVLTFAISCLLNVIKFKLIGVKGNHGIMSCIINPLIVFASIELFLFFSNLNITKFNKTIAKISTLSFGIYLIHEQYFIVKIITDMFANVANDIWYIMTFKIFAISFVIYVICALIDFIREALFKLLKINMICDKFGLFLNKLDKNN